MKRTHRIVHDRDCDYADEIVGQESALCVSGPTEIVAPRTPGHPEERRTRAAFCSCGANPALANNPIGRAVAALKVAIDASRNGPCARSLTAEECVALLEGWVDR